MARSRWYTRVVKVRVPLGLSLGLATSGALAHCFVYDTALLVAVGLDAGPDSGEAGSDAGGCAHLRWPERPAVDDPAGGDLTLYEALHTIDFGLGADGGPTPLLGFDLDGICTCQGQPPAGESCAPAPNTTHCDMDAGVDNAGAGVVRAFSSLPGFFEQDFINARISGGFYGALVRVSKYNGKPNDTQVEAAFFPSNGTTGIEQGIPVTPSWTGDDRWTLDPSALLGSTIPDGGQPAAKYVDQSAYVRDGMLVASLSFPIFIGASAGDSTLTVDLVGAVVTARLVPDNGTFRLEEGVIAGRWPTARMLTALAVLHDPLDPQKLGRLCGTNATYKFVKNQMCSAADIATNLLEDGRGAPCSAITVGIAFTANAATFANTFPRADGGFPCGPQWTDSCP